MGGYYKYIRWLSLDIVAGAIFFLYLLEGEYGLNFPLSVYMALSAAVWIIYNVDHLIDSQKSIKSERRAFHARFYRSILLVVGGVGILGLVTVYYLPEAVIRNGAILSALCVVYLLTVYCFKGLWIKEVIVALGYAAGLFIGPFSLTERFGQVDVLLFFQLVIVALINLIIFSVYDAREDREADFGSLVGRLGVPWSRGIINGLASLQLGFIIYTWYQYPAIATLQAVYLLMTVALLVVHWFPGYFSQRERFRVVGDAVFFIPLFFV